MKLIHGMTKIEFEIYVCGKYRSKVNDAKNRKLEFNLTFVQFRSLLARKTCYYTDVELTLPLTGPGVNGNGQTIRPTDITIERIDNKLGYVHGNCIAVCSAANSVKSVFENPQTPLSVDDAIRMFTRLENLNKRLTA